MKKLLAVGGCLDGQMMPVMSDGVHLHGVPKIETPIGRWVDEPEHVPQIDYEMQRYHRCQITDGVFVFALEGLSRTEIIQKLVENYRPNELEKRVSRKAGFSGVGKRG